MEGIRGIQHPLETPIVLDCIFKNLDFHDLQRCREVCRTWRQESGKAMRALAKVEIQCVEPSPRGPSEFLELVKNDKSTFFEAPFAEEFTLKAKGVGLADCPEFWEFCGTKIKRLQLNFVTFSSAGAFRHAIFQCSPNLEKLEIFEVKVLGEPTRDPNEWIAPQFTQNRNLKSLSLSFCFGASEFRVNQLEILSHFPCLENLHVIAVFGRPDFFESVFRALEAARQHDASCWKLTEVKLSAGFLPIPVPQSFARVFGKGDLTLTSLSIDGIASDMMNVNTVQKIIIAHAQSLKKLEIIQKDNDFREMDIFPLPGNQILEKVQALKLNRVKMRSTRILQAFPNLEKLIMLNVEEIPEDTRTPHVTLKNCTQLILLSLINETGDFKRLFSLLPNLRKLAIHYLDNERFSLICANWPDLTHLELGDRCPYLELRVDDVGISGYDREDVEKINQRGREGSGGPITVRRASLSSLKNLHSFSLRINYEAGSKVGYCSEACGILELPNLKHLRVDREERTGNGFERVPFVPMFESLSEQFPWNDSQEITID